MQNSRPRHNESFVNLKSKGCNRWRFR